jgi:sugar phosphate isomerase/epimerase
MLRFALQAGMTPGSTFAEKFANLHRWGYDGVEVGGGDLRDRRDELLRATTSSGVPIVSVIGGYTGWLVDPNPRARALAIAQISALLPLCAEVGAAGLVAPAAFGVSTRNVLPPFRHVFDADEHRAVLLDSLQQIADAANANGGTLLLEPLNRYEDSALNTVAEGVALIKEIGSPHIKLIPDFFHMNIEEADIARSLRDAAPHIGHVHLGDSNRLLPGLGHTDFASGFRALQEAGYDGALAIECRVTGDPETELLRTLRFLRAAAGQ